MTSYLDGSSILNDPPSENNILSQLLATQKHLC
jgi:hypothetical protein